MESDLIQRARRLNAAAQAMADRLQATADNPSPPPSSSTPRQQSSPFDKAEAALTTSPRRNEGEESHREFKGAAFNGSSLLTTFTDLRPFLNRGDGLLVDEIPCAIKGDGEFSASRVELCEDFQGKQPNASSSASHEQWL